jgi:hypothetical protein
MSDFFYEQNSLTREERITAKLLKIQNSLTGRTWDIGKYTIELVDITFSGYAVTLFVRVWLSGNQIGFGADGTVDVEKLIIKNPPVFVPDETGDIEVVGQENPDQPGIGGTVARFREAPLLALRNAVMETLSRKTQFVLNSQAIVPGKVGQTTLTVYPEVGDGYVGMNTTTWSGARDTTSGNDLGYTGTQDIIAKAGRISASDFRVYRGFLAFDTDDIGAGGTIDSATITLRLWQRSCCGYNTRYLNFTSGSQSSTSTLENADYDNIGTSKWATSLLIDGNETGTPSKVWTLNSTGLSGINKTGFTKCVLRADLDIDNTAPTNDANVNFYSVESTSYDPVLVVEYTAGSTFIPRTAYFM